MIMDKMQKESFAQHGIQVEWDYSYRNKRIATFLFPSSEELGPSWFIGNQLRLRLMDDWAGKGVGLRITENDKIVLEMLKDNAPEDSNGKLITTGFSVEFVWNSVTFDRMVKGIKKFVNNHSSISLPLYEMILGKR